MWKYTYQDELYHYGIKGMKWGVIRTAEQLGHTVKSAKSLYNSNKAKKRAKEEAAIAKKRSKITNPKKRAKEEAAIAKKRSKITNPKKLTTEELNTRIKRLQLEKTYKDLMKDTESTTRGKNFVMDIMESSGKNLFTQVTNHYGAKALNKVIGEDVIFANNKRK